MCMVSSVHDMGRQDWDQQKREAASLDQIKKLLEDARKASTPITVIPKVPVIPFLDVKLLKEWKATIEKMIKIAEDYDKATNQPHCEDPMKMAWMEEVNRRLAELEKQQTEKEVKKGDDFQYPYPSTPPYTGGGLTITPPDLTFGDHTGSEIKC